MKVQKIDYQATFGLKSFDLDPKITQDLPKMAANLQAITPKALKLGDSRTNIYIKRNITGHKNDFIIFVSKGLNTLKLFKRGFPKKEKSLLKLMQNSIEIFNTTIKKAPSLKKLAQRVFEARISTKNPYPIAI